MTKNNYLKELNYLKWYNINEEKKIKFIRDLYILANINFNNFSKNFWQKIN